MRALVALLFVIGLAFAAPLPTLAVVACPDGPCPEVVEEQGYCWCEDDSARCIAHEGRMTRTACRDTCARLDRKAIHFDTGPYLDRYAGGGNPPGLPACGAAPAADAKKDGGKQAPVPRLSSPIGALSIQEYLGRIIKAILGISGGLALAVFIWGGFTYLTSGGAPEKIELGKKTLVWASLGLLIIFGAFILVNFVIEALGKATG